MNELLKIVRHPEHWVINVQLLVLYVISTLLFFAIHLVTRKAAGPLHERARAKQVGAYLGILVVAALSNFAGVAALVLLARKLATVPPLALIGLPLFLILEQHVRRMRATPADARVQALSAGGATVGMISAAFLLMRGSPIK